MGLKEAGRCPTNLPKVKAIIQRSDETPVGFLGGLLKGYRMYTPFDPMASDRQANVVMSFI